MAAVPAAAAVVPVPGLNVEGSFGLPKKWAYILYNVGGPVMWHQRLCLGTVVGYPSRIVAVTPDRDVYVEVYDGLNDDLSAVRYSDVRRPSPPGLGAQVYRFAMEPGARLVAWERLAEAAAREDLVLMGCAVPVGSCLLAIGALDGAAPAAPAPGAVPVPGAPLAAAAVVPARPPAPFIGAVRGVAPAAAAVHTTGVWRAAASLGGFRYGDEVPGHVRSAGAVAKRDLALLPDGTGLFVELVDAGGLEEFFGRAVAADARILAVRRTPGGKRERTWAQVAAEMQPEDLGADWGLPGPRSAGWCITHIDHEGMGLDGHHDRFKTLCKLDPNAWGVQAHYNTSQRIKQLLCVDQYDGSNSEGIESMFRELQTIEFAYGEKAEEAEAKAIGGKLSLEEQSAFMGTVRAHTSVMVMPELLDHVRESVEKDAKLAKAMRMAREEKDARAKR